MFNQSKLKHSYVGIVSIYDLRNKKVLLQGGGHFDVACKKLDVLFDCQETHQDVEWFPIIATEYGYFCPANTQKGHLIGCDGFAFDCRRRYDMSSYFHWNRDKGIDHITKTFDAATIEVGGLTSRPLLPKHSKDRKSIEVTATGFCGAIEEAKLPT